MLANLFEDVELCSRYSHANQKVTNAKHHRNEVTTVIKAKDLPEIWYPAETVSPSLPVMSLKCSSKMMSVSVSTT